MSPFSAVITNLKKSLIKSKYGTPFTSPPPYSAVKTENKALALKIVKLENTILSIQSDDETAVQENQNYSVTIYNLQDQLVKKSFNIQIKKEASDDDLLLKTKPIETLEENQETLKNKLFLENEELMQSHTKIEALEHDLSDVRFENDQLK